MSTGYPPQETQDEVESVVKEWVRENIVEDLMRGQHVRSGQILDEVDVEEPRRVVGQCLGCYDWLIRESNTTCNGGSRYRVEL
jgi:hypothetical protein